MASFIFVNQYLLLSDSEWYLSTFVNKNLLLSRSGDCHLSSASVCLWGQSCLTCQVIIMRALQEVAYGWRNHLHDVLCPAYCGKICTAAHCAVEARHPVPGSSSCMKPNMAVVTLLLKHPVLTVSSYEVAIAAFWVKL